MILRALPALLIFFGIGSATYDPETGFAIGIFGPITEFSQDDLAAAVLFDLDLRKHRDPDLRQRLGPPILDIPNLHPDLKIRVMVGTSHGQSTIGVATALDWLYGQNGTQKVVGIVGGAYSSISMSVASVCDVFNTPQVSFGATSRSLSDKTMYPWFLRTIAPNSFQGQAMWAWMNVAGVPSVVFFYRSLEAYGEGLFQVAFDQAFAANQPRRVSGIGIDLSGEIEGDRMAMIPRVLDIKAMGTKFIVIAFSSTINVALAMYAMEQQEMLYSDYQILGADGLALPDSSPYLPSRGYPQGCMRFAPVAAGERFPLFENTWHNMTPDDLYSPEARSRYMLDRFRSPLDDAPTPKLVASDFTDGLPFFYSNFLVDAAFGFVVAINNLLNAGVSPAKIYGEQLLTELRSISFEGVTGHVAFDENADRIGDWELGNVKVEGGIMQSVAVWESASTSLLESITFHDPNNEALTWITGDVSLKAPKALTACALGQRWDTSAGLCIFCDVNEGAVQDESGDPSCISCGPGSVSIQPFGALSCEKCPAGTFRDSTLVNCTPCAAGSFADEPGRSACDACDSGQYVATEGATACDACGGDQSSTFTTLERTLDSSGQRALSLKFGADSASFCGCRPHFREDSFGGCVACAEGMICQGLNETTIASGYYADFVSPQGELSVFKCFGESERCAGGLPGHTCAPGRQGLTCSECEDGKTPKSGGSCVDCEGSDLGPFVAAICAGFATLLLAYYLVDTQNRVTQSHALLLAACAAGQLVTVTQQLGVVGKLSTSWEEPIKSFMNVVQLLALNLEVLRLNCVGSVNPLQRFSIKLTLIFVTIAFMLVIHAASVSLRHKCRWRKQIYSLIGSVGMLFMVFNIAVTSAVLEPFQCEQHPNDKWTMRPSPGVLCWDSDDDHRFMVLGGALAFILVPLAFMVTCYIVVKQFPKRMQAGDAEFLKAFAFLFFRFRASQHWYAFYQIIRNFGVAMVLVIPDVSTQVLVLAMILLVGFGMSLYLWPWRVDYANALDCLFGGCSLMVVCMSGLFLDSDQKNLAGTSWMILIFVCICLFGGPLAITYGLCKRYLRWKKPFQFFLCHHKSGSGAYVRLLKMHLRESSHLKSGVFVDSDNLDNLDHLFDHVGMDTENLVVICSELIFTRPWCVGEMCVARLKGVNVTLVALPNHVLPDEVFISDLSNRISDLEVLIESGISDEMIAETLRWIEENPTINVPEAVTPLIMDMVASKLFLRESATIEEGSRHSKSMDGKSGYEAGQSLMLFDHTNMEAAATALIIRKLLTPHLTHNTKKIPELILEDSRGSHVASDVCGPVLVVCTRGIFETTQVMRFFVRTSRLAVTFLPLICEQNFSVPRRDIAMTFRRSGSAAAFDEKEISTLASVITVVFREIAVHFDAQYSSLTILDVAAKSVARRLLEDKTLSNSMGPVGSILAQKGAPAGKAAAAGASHGPAPDVITEAPPSAGSHKEANSSTDVLRYMGDAPPMAMPMVTIEDITRPGFRYELAM